MSMKSLMYMMTCPDVITTLEVYRELYDQIRRLPAAIKIIMPENTCKFHLKMILCYFNALEFNYESFQTQK